MKILLLSFYDLGKQPKIISELYQKLNNGTNEIDIVDYSVEENYVPMIPLLSDNTILAEEHLPMQSIGPDSQMSGTELVTFDFFSPNVLTALVKYLFSA